MHNYPIADSGESEVGWIKKTKIGRIARIAMRKVLLLCPLAAIAIPSMFTVNSQAGQGYALIGIGGGPKALNSYQGLIYAPMSGLSQTGPILRFWNKAYRFSYDTVLPGPTNTTISAIGFHLEAQAGYQFANEIGRIALYGGVVWSDHILTPRDPGSNLTKSRIGFSATLDGEYKFSSNLGIMANASYLQGFGQYWAQVKPYYKAPSNWKIGPDIALFGGKNYKTTRIGLFASDYQLKLWSNKKIFLGADIGVQFSMKGKNFTPYIGINSGFLF